MFDTLLHRIRTILAIVFPESAATAKAAVPTLRTTGRAVSLTLVLVLGATMVAVGTKSLAAQTTDPADCSEDEDGSLCARGEKCILGFCWSIESYWPSVPERDFCPAPS